MHILNDENPGLAPTRNGGLVDESKKSFLSQSLHGSRRHLRSLACNALDIVAQRGKQTLFVTVTCNPMWPEIVEALGKNMTAFERPDIVDHVFKLRLDALLDNIRRGKYFGGHKSVYIIRVVEYQHRGMPHAHIVLKLENMPDEDDHDGMQVWIDEFISARLPTKPVVGVSSPADIKYYDLVIEKMTHTHAMKKQLLMNAVCFSIYWRPNAADKMIVSHNRLMLLDWDGHCKVVFAGSTFCVLYLYKYLFKYLFKARCQESIAAIK